MMPYDYNDYRSYLRDWFWTTKARNPRLSFRSVSRRLGLKSPNHFHLVISGKRHLSKALFDKALGMIRLGAKERHFLDLLFQIAHVDRTDEKAVLVQQVELLRKAARSQSLGPEQYQLVAHTLAWNIRMAASYFDGLKPDELAETAKKCAMFAVTDDQIDDALRLLAQVGLMQVGDDGRCHFDDSDITTKWNFESESIKAHHRGNLNLALQTIPWPIDQRFFTSVTIPCYPGLRADIVADLRALSIKLLEASKISDPGQDGISHLMTLQVAFFPFFEFQGASLKSKTSTGLPAAPPKPSCS